MPLPDTIDTLILGAGAAGLFAGGIAGQRGHSVLVIDHSAKPAEKVRISGGGRCNFTNIDCAPNKFLSDNPHFAKSALARYTPWDFISLISEHGLTWHEKTLGQLFADSRSEAIIRVLLAELEKGQSQLSLSTSVSAVSHDGSRFRVETSDGTVKAKALIVATGGLSIPKMGATGFAYDLARQFGLKIIQPRAALVPFTVTDRDKEAFAKLAGVAVPIKAQTQGYGSASFEEALLFTHRGVSGPAMLQLSSYWREGEPVEIDLFKGKDAASHLKSWKDAHPKRALTTCLEDQLPDRLVTYFVERGTVPADLRLADASHKQLEAVADALSHWVVKPAGTEGWRTAEVTAGGIDTEGLSSKTMEAKTVPGLYFIGECVDVTGWLGGYNFQWAWASAHAAATAL